MFHKPRILITNDDGIYAPGIKHLWRALHQHADLFIIAPSKEQSGAALSMTINSPLNIQEVPWEGDTPAWSVNGTPSDCVKLALSVILDKKPDLIVSGINRGTNAGRNVLYSGTIGGVIEGALKNIGGIAFSHEDLLTPQYQNIEKFIFPIISYFLNVSFPEGSFLNVTFPNTDKIKGFKMARQGKSYWIESPNERKHPNGHSYYWLGGKWMDVDEVEDSDVALLKNGYITAVPIRVNELTDYSLLNTHKISFEDLFDSLEPAGVGKGI